MDIERAAANTPVIGPGPDRPARVAGYLIALLAAVAIAAPWLAPHEAGERIGAPFQTPGPGHWLGTNDVGNDLASELLHGARGSLSISLPVAVLAILVGTLVGTGAGYAGGLRERVAMRLVDVTLALPLLPLTIVVAAFVGQGAVTQVALLSMLLWARPARLLRARTLEVRESGYVEAARAVGTAPSRMVLRHVLPAVGPLIVAEFVRVAAAALLIQTALSFLGLGDPTQPSWGTTLYYAAARGAVLSDAWIWWVVPPGLMVSVTTMSLALVGIVVERRFDRRRRRAMRPGRWVRPARDDARAGRSHPDRSPAPLLSVRGLSVAYPERGRATYPLRDVDLHLQRGEVLGVSGESGCGKTTLAMAIVGLLPASARVVDGSIEYDGIKLLGLEPRESGAFRGRRIALVPQSAGGALDPSCRVCELVAEAVRVHSGATVDDARRRAAGLLADVGLGEDRSRAYPHQLSGGMARRAVIALALAGRPELLIADEPTAGLDTVSQRRIVGLLCELVRKRRMAMIVIAHDFALLGGVSDRIALMYAGRVVEKGPVQRVMSAPLHPYAQAMLDVRRDPESGAEALPGEPADLQNVPAGCAFHPRCLYAIGRCRREVPELRRARAGGHAAACHLVDEDI